jgi:hemoglobin
MSQEVSQGRDAGGVMPDDAAALERDIERCVRLFYAKAQEDELLGPVVKRIHDWEHHYSRIAGFWSRILLGTARYDGHPYGVHHHMPLEPEHFTRWVSLFEETARETLPAPQAKLAIERAQHMSACFQSGIFPFKDRDGQPSRLPYKEASGG